MPLLLPLPLQLLLPPPLLLLLPASALGCKHMPLTQMLVLALPTKGPAPAAKAATATAPLLPLPNRKTFWFDRGKDVFLTNPSTDFSDGSPLIFQMVLFGGRSKE